MSGEHIAIHAARVKKLVEQEEEEMTTYSSEDLDANWEFKIVPSTTRAFRNADILAALLEEESLAGWELVEKLDDQRIRLKRPRDARSKDHRLPPGFDPYRTQYGSSSNPPIVATLFGLVIALVLGVAAIFLVNAPNISILSLVSVLIPGIMVLVGIGAIIAVARNRR